MTETTKTTRKASPKKPEDHKPAADEVVQFDYEGVTVQVFADCFEDLEVVGQMREGDLVGAVRGMILEDETTESVLKKVREKDARGRIMARNFETLLESIAEACGVKN